MNSSARWKAIGLLLGVFVLGTAFGGVATVLINKHVYGAVGAPPPPQAPLQVRAVARLNQDLKLTPDQQVQVTQILTDMQNGYDDIRQQMNPRFDVVREEGRNRIRGVLTPEQQPKFQEYLRKLDEDRRRRGVIR